MICIIGMMGFGITLLNSGKCMGQCLQPTRCTGTLGAVGTFGCRLLALSIPRLPEKDQSVAAGRLTERRLKGQDQALLPLPTQCHLFLSIKPALLWAGMRPQPHSTLGQACLFRGHV